MELDLTAVLQEFEDEAAEHLAALNAQLLALERDPAAPGPIRNMFLSAHTIKGSAAMLNLKDISGLAHAMEDVLAHLRDTRLALDRGTADLLFQALDALRDRVGRSRPGSTVTDPILGDLIVALRRRHGGQVETGPAPSAEQPVPDGMPRALLVDDSPTVRMLETMQLMDAGFRVDAVADGGQALALALANTYRLIVTAIECQVLRGWELAGALREVVSRRAVPIIMMSSDDNPDDRRRAEEMGIYAYLQKGSLARQQLEETARAVAIGAGPLATREGVA
jgi:chemotaxis protein histidine kinase CheA